MRPTAPLPMRVFAPMLLALTLSACAATLPCAPSAAITPHPPIPPPAVLASAPSVTAWQRYSQRAQDWLQRVSSEVMSWP